MPFHCKEVVGLAGCDVIPGAGQDSGGREPTVHVAVRPIKDHFRHRDTIFIQTKLHLKSIRNNAKLLFSFFKV